MSAASQNRSSSSATDRKPSTTSRKHTSASSTLDRRTERSSRVTRETITVRTRSPLKQTSESRVNGQKRREHESPVPQLDEELKTTKAVDALGEFGDYNESKCCAYGGNRAMESSSIDYTTHDGTTGDTNICSTTCKVCPANAPIATTIANEPTRAGEGYGRRSAVCLYGLRGPIHPI
jgi:hypothetical protein